MATLQNQAGQFVIPNETNAAATLATVELPENLRAFIVEINVVKSWQSLVALYFTKCEDTRS